eukprot:4345434-Pleurochrysis_carterae.AAC.1
MEAARARPSPFTSFRNLVAEDSARLAQEPLPADLRDPRAGACAAKRARAANRRRLPAGAGLPAGCVVERDEEGRRPEGRIRIAQLFLGGVYEAYVGAWLREADAAVAALRAQAGGAVVEVPDVPTRVLGQELLQPWARGVVWDCRDLEQCAPVVPSSRHTQFPGARQVDRAALRRVAAELGWGDEDIVAQVGEGGVETRADCDLTT